MEVGKIYVDYKDGPDGWFGLFSGCERGVFNFPNNHDSLFSSITLLSYLIPFRQLGGLAQCGSCDNKGHQ